MPWRSDLGTLLSRGPQCLLRPPRLTGCARDSRGYLGDQASPVGCQSLQILLFRRFGLPLVGLEDPRQEQPGERLGVQPEVTLLLAGLCL